MDLLRNGAITCNRPLDQVLRFLLGCLKVLKICAGYGSVWISEKNMVCCILSLLQGTGIITESSNQGCLKNSDRAVVLLLAHMLKERVEIAHIAAYTRLLAHLFPVGMDISGKLATNFHRHYFEHLFRSHSAVLVLLR